MILKQGEWRLMHAVQIEPGEISTAYLCDDLAHAERLAAAFAEGKGIAPPPIVRVHIRADVIGTCTRQPREGGPPPSLLGDWMASRPNRQRKHRP